MGTNRTENFALLRGIVAGEPELSHRVHGIPFYRFSLSVPRLSGREDLLNILAPGALLEDCPLTPGLPVEVSGEVRSFNNRSGVGSRLVITLFAKHLSKADAEFFNEVQLGGVICRPPIFRRTPLGRDICDMLLAVNRKYHRADYLPCIAWGSLASHCAQLQVGDPLAFSGRLQSRQYIKTSGEESVEHTAYEISVMTLLPPED